MRTAPSRRPTLHNMMREGAPQLLLGIVFSSFALCVVLTLTA